MSEPLSSQERPLQNAPHSFEGNSYDPGFLSLDSVTPTCIAEKHPAASLWTLPAELQRQIVESSITHTFSNSTYHERQDTLCALSLVSHQFREIAQPLLFEIVWLGRRRQYDAWQATFGADETHDNLLRSVHTILAGDDEEDVKRLLRGPSMLRNLCLYDMTLSNDTLDTMSSLVNLSSLHLVLCNTPEPTPPRLSPLLNLRVLTLNETSHDLAMSLLDPEVLPSLEVFALVERSHNTYDALAESRLRRLAPQLDALFFDSEVWVLSDVAFLHPWADRTLIDLCLGAVDDLLDPESMIVNARLSDGFDGYNDGHCDYLVDKLDYLWSSLEQRSHLIPLRRLYLDPALSPLHAQATEIRKEAEKLAKVCREREIEIVYEPQYSHFPLDPYISVDFWRRQKESRKK